MNSPPTHTHSFAHVATILCTLHEWLSISCESVNLMSRRILRSFYDINEHPHHIKVKFLCKGIFFSILFWRDLDFFFKALFAYLTTIYWFFHCIFYDVPKPQIFSEPFPFYYKSFSLSFVNRLRNTFTTRRWKLSW